MFAGEQSRAPSAVVLLCEIPERTRCESTLRVDEPQRRVRDRKGDRLHIMILGASGLIGSALTAHLSQAGHSLVAVGRRLAPGLAPARHLKLDISRMTEPEKWRVHLAGVDAVVNCAGVLQDDANNSTAGVHVHGISALFRACEQSGVRRVVHLSAVGLDQATPTEFSRTKLAGDRALMALDLDWVILRPSVVIGRAAYGGSALLRGLAALPVRPVMPHTAPLQPVLLADLVDAATFFLQPEAPARRIIEVVGPRQYAFDDLVGLFRRWMRWPAARVFTLPAWMSALVYRLGDLVALLGWQPPIRTTAQLEMVRGARGDASAMTQSTGIRPRALEDELGGEPASVQERWFSRLYLLKPLIIGVSALFWMGTAFVSLGPGWENGINLMISGGASRSLAALAVLAGGLADLVIGAAMLYRRTARLAFYGAVAISLTYAIIGSIIVPWLWAEPLGPLLKIWPLIVLNLVALAILEDR